MYKNHSSFWNRLLLLLTFIICTSYITGFLFDKYVLMVFQENIGSHGS